MILLNGYCKACDQIVEIKRDSDLPDFCPECRSVDTIDFDIEKYEEDDYPEIIQKVLNKLAGE